jgi:hypothetical protein
MRLMTFALLLVLALVGCRPSSTPPVSVPSPSSGSVQSALGQERLDAGLCDTVLEAQIEAALAMNAFERGSMSGEEFKERAEMAVAVADEIVLYDYGLFDSAD